MKFSIPKFFFLISYLSFFILFCGITLVSAQLKEVPPKSIKVNDKSDPIKLEMSDNSDPTEVTCNWLDPDYSNFADFQSTTNPTTLILLGKRATSSAIFLKCYKDESFILIKISVIPEVPEAKLTIVGSSIEPKSLNLVKGQILNLKVPINVKLELETKDTQVATLSGDNGSYEIKANKKTSEPIKLLAKSNSDKIDINGVSEIPLVIADIIIKKTVKQVKGDKPLPITDFVNFDSTSPGFEPTIKLKFTPIGSSVEISDNKLRPLSFNPAAQVAITSDTGRFEGENKFFEINVQNNVKGLRIESGAGNIVVVGQTLTLYASVVDDDGKKIIAPVKWELVNSNSHKEFISVPSSGQSIQILGLSAPPEENTPIRIRAIYTDDAGGIDSDEFVIFVRGKRNVVGFDFVKVKLDVLDKRTAKDLFGGRANDEYHIAKIRILNNLEKNKNAGPASSIIFFSDSLEVKVALEKKYVGKDNSKKKGWESLTEENIRYINGWEKCDSSSKLASKRQNTRDYLRNECINNIEIEQEKCKQLYNPKDIYNLENPNDPKIVAEREKTESKQRQCLLEQEIRKNRCLREVDEVTDDFVCSDDLNCITRNEFCNRDSVDNQALDGHWITYRPYIFQVVANTHDRRASRSTRNMLFLGARSLTGLTSFITTFWIPGAGSDLPVALERFQNLLIPTAERLFPSLQESQRQNIITEVLPPLVEVAYGSDVSKHIFFPKKPIEGILPNYEVKISSLSIYKIKVEVGIVQKGTALQQTP